MEPDSEHAPINWADHAGLISGVAAASFVALRILVISGMDPNTAKAILQTSSTSTVLLGALLSGLPVVVVVASVLVSDAAAKVSGAGKVVVIALYLIVSSFILNGVLFGLTILLLFQDWWDRRKAANRGNPVASRPTSRQTAAFAVATAVVLAWWLPSWYPPERVQHGTRVVTAEVIGQDSAAGELVLLRDDRIERTPIRGTTRAICRSDDQFFDGRPVIWSLWSKKTYTPCP